MLFKIEYHGIQTAPVDTTQNHVNSVDIQKSNAIH